MTVVLVRRGNVDTGVCTQRDGHVKTLGEYCHLQVKERGLDRQQPHPHLNLGLTVSIPVRK